MDSVNWPDAQQFLEELNLREKDAGWVYRLPTQAEWEYACRNGPSADKADSGFDYYFDRPSAKLLPNQANVGGVLKRTCKVGSYPRNRLGLYDMHGNVLEWCHDDLPGNPKNPQAGPARVLRGGGWLLPASSSAAREVIPAGTKLGNEARYNDRGLRVARVRVVADGTGVPRAPDGK